MKKKIGKKLIQSIPAAFIILMGAAVEIQFYHYKFVSDGWPVIGAYIAGTAATIFLIYLSTKINLFSVFAIVGLVAFSVFCTISGQAYFYAHISNISAHEAVSDRGVIDTISDLQTEIDKLRFSRDIKQDELDNMDDSDRYSWEVAGQNADGSAAYQKGESPTFTALKNELDSLNIQIERKESLLYDLKLNNNVDTNIDIISEDTYKYIADRLKIDNDFLMFFLRLLLSLVFAAMAPYGFNRLMPTWNPKKQRTKLRDIIDKMLTIRYDNIMEKLDAPKKKETKQEIKGEFDYLDTLPKKRITESYTQGEIRHGK